MKLVMVVVFLAAGCLEIVSILFRPVSLSFRLYGNIFMKGGIEEIKQG
jgi:F-type H+-transporting ATPase subunit a